MRKALKKNNVFSEMLDNLRKPVLWWINNSISFLTQWNFFSFWCFVGIKELTFMWSFNLSDGFSSVQFSCSVMPNSLQPHGLQYVRLPCPSPAPRIYPNSCPLSWWCHPTISSSVVPFSSFPQYFPASGSFQMSQLFWLHQVAKVLVFQL